MKNVQAQKADARSFVANLYQNGRTPSERFGVTWEQLSALEEKVPSLTQHTRDNQRESA